MKGNVATHSVVILEREEPGSSDIKSDRPERHDPLLTGHPVVVTEREPAVAELRVPADAMQELVERLHARQPLTRPSMVRWERMSLS